MKTNDFWRYVAILRKRLWVILLLFAATMIMILAYVWTTPPTYSASMLLQVIPLEPVEVPLFTRTSTVSTADINDLIMFQFETAVRSQTVALRTIADTGVNMSTDELLHGVNFRREPGGEFVTVSVQASTPQEAERLVTVHVDNALDALRRGRTRPLITTGKFLKTALSNANQALETARADLLHFKLANGFESLERATQAEQDTLRALHSAQENARLEVQRMNAMAKELERQSKDAQAKAEAAPKDSTEAAQWAKLAYELQQAAINRRVDAAGQDAVQASYYTILSQHENNLATLITLNEKYQQLQDIVREKEDSRDFLAGKVREADLKESQSSTVGYMQVIGTPNTARSPLAARMVRIALLGSALSLVAGVVLAFVLEFLSQVWRPPANRQDM